MAFDPYHKSLGIPSTNQPPNQVSVLNHEMLSIGEQIRPENPLAKPAEPGPKAPSLGDLTNDKDPAEKASRPPTGKLLR
jgi:hypothetical protein